MLSFNQLNDHCHNHLQRVTYDTAAIGDILLIVMPPSVRSICTLTSTRRVYICRHDPNLTIGATVNPKLQAADTFVIENAANAFSKPQHFSMINVNKLLARAGLQPVPAALDDLSWVQEIRSHSGVTGLR